MTKYLGISYENFLPFGKLMLDKAIKDGLSIAVMEGDKVVACSIVEDIADPLDPNFRIIFSFLEHLVGEFFKEKHFETRTFNSFVYYCLLSKNYFGKGLSRKVNLDSIHHAKKLGYDFMCCEFTYYLNEKGTVKHLKYGGIHFKAAI